MANKWDGIPSYENFDKILAAIKPALKENADIKQLNYDLYTIKWNAIISGQDELENSPTIAKMANFLGGMAQQIEALLERKRQIEKLYPVLECTDTGRRLETTPNWLSKHTDKINFDELKAAAKGLRLLEESAREEIIDGKKPRLSARPYYIRELIKIYEKHAKDKAIVRKHKPTVFSDFVKAYFQHGGTVLKMKTIELGALYDEYERLKK